MCTPIGKIFHHIQKPLGKANASVLSSGLIFMQRSGFPNFRLFSFDVSNIKKAKSAFTLFELLTVISIMIILSTASVPVLTQAFRSSSLTQGGNLLFDLAVLARQSALNKNTIVALVIVSKPARTAELQTVGLVEFNPSQHKWEPMGRWEHMPEAVEVVDSPNDATAAKDLTADIAPLDLTVGGTPIAASQYTSLVFYPDGRLATPPAATANTRELSVRFSADSKINNYYNLVLNDDTSAVRIVRP